MHLYQEFAPHPLLAAHVAGQLPFFQYAGLKLRHHGVF
jgi:hypothetical protein